MKDSETKRSKKKVLFVATVDQHLRCFHYPIMKWFREEGYEVHVASRGDGELLYTDTKYDIPFERFPLKISNIFAYKQLKSIIAENDFTLVHCHTPVGGILTRFAARKLRKSGLKVIYTAHGFHFYKGAPIINWILYFPIEWICSFFTDVLITTNHEDFQLARTKLKAAATEYVCGVGVNVDCIRKDNDKRETKKEELKLPKGKVILLSVGELSKRKNHQIIIRALAQMSDYNLHYVICGDGPMRLKLYQLCEKLKLENRVSFMGYREDVEDIYKIADIFVFPSLQEGLPVALMQAMASRLPVVCSKIRGNVDLVTDLEGGYLCEKKSINEFVQRIKGLVNNPNERVKMGIINEINVKNFSVEVVLSEMTSIYKHSK